MFQIKLSVFTVGHDIVMFGQFFPFLWEDTCCGCSFRCFSVSDPGFLMHFDFSPGETDSNRQHPRLYILLGLWSQGCMSEYPLLFLPPIYHSHFVSTMVALGGWKFTGLRPWLFLKFHLLFHFLYSLSKPERPAFESGWISFYMRNVGWLNSSLVFSVPL